MIVKLIGFVVLSVSVMSASADAGWEYSLHSQCPFNNPANSWRDYMTAKFKPEPTHIARPTPSNPHPHLVSGEAQVEFRYANAVNDRDALPGINPSICYGIKYQPGRGFSSWRREEDGVHPNDPDARHERAGLPGDPANYEINIEGHILKYDEAGRVFNLKGAVVGTLVCYSSNHCGRYGYKKVSTSR